MYCNFSESVIIRLSSSFSLAFNVSRDTSSMKVFTGKSLPYPNSRLIIPAICNNVRVPPAVLGFGFGIGLGLEAGVLLVIVIVDDKGCAT